MIEERCAFLHRILIITKGCDTLFEEVIKRSQRIVPCHTPTK